MSRLLLDTNVLVWLLLSEPESISSPAKEALASCGAIVVSSVSVWEIAIKRSRGKLDISEQWFDRLEQLDFDPLVVKFIHAREVENLPLLHRDPFDRLLIGQSVVEELSIVTADSRFREYGVEVIW